MQDGQRWCALATCGSIPKMKDVFAIWLELTGLEWYPEPHKVEKNALWKEAREKVDEIIKAQAETLGVCHCAAQSQVSEPLCPASQQLFVIFKSWLEASGQLNCSFDSQGHLYCPGCGMILSSSVCPTCGPIVDIKNINNCPNCGVSISGDECKSCGPVCLYLD